MIILNIIYRRTERAFWIIAGTEIMDDIECYMKIFASEMNRDVFVKKGLILSGLLRFFSPRGSYLAGYNPQAKTISSGKVILLLAESF